MTSALKPTAVVKSFHDEISKDGAFNRTASVFRDWIKKDGSTPYAPEKGRYHLYVSYACPWASRTLMVRKLKGLEDVIGYSNVDWYLDRSVGWRFTEADPDHLHPENKLLRTIYEKSDKNFLGKVTVPALYDTKTQRIVNNESSEIIKMMNSEFDDFAKNPSLDLYPKELQDEIEQVNTWVYDTINNGVYKCGFSQSQEAYEKAYKDLFASMDRVEAILAKQRYIVSNKQITLADIRLFTTLIRFDAVYFTHFKCNKNRLIEYENIYNYTKEIYQTGGVKDTVNMFHIKHHYFGSHKHINPFGIVPLGPDLDFDSHHNRNQKFK